MDRRQFVLGGVVAFTGIALSGCHYTGHDSGPAPGYGRRPGPPPHAPAHGYRHRHPSGFDMIFDSGLGVYTVVGYPYYFYGGHFYRRHNSVWQRSAKPRGQWRSADHGRVPSKLWKKYDKKPRRRGRGRGRGRGRDWGRDRDRDRRY